MPCKEEIIKTPIIINRKTIFLAAHYHGCLVNFVLILLVIMGVLLIRYLVNSLIR
jgi:hypothetical protein